MLKKAILDKYSISIHLSEDDLESSLIKQLIKRGSSVNIGLSPNPPVALYNIEEIIDVRVNGRIYDIRQATLDIADNHTKHIELVFEEIDIVSGTLVEVYIQLKN